MLYIILSLQLELGVLIIGKVLENSVRPPKECKPTKQAFLVQETGTELWGTVGGWITVTLPTLFLRMLSETIF